MGMGLPEGRGKRGAGSVLKTRVLPKPGRNPPGKISVPAHHCLRLEHGQGLGLYLLYKKGMDGRQWKERTLRGGCGKVQIPELLFDELEVKVR